MSGASAEKIHRAFTTHDNVVGPGAYDGVNRSMFGAKQGSSRKINAPGFSFGKSTSRVTLNPENKGSIQSPHSNPSPLDYNIPSDNFRFRKNSMRLDRKQDRFFTPTNMPKISEQTAVQYTALDGISHSALGEKTPLQAAKGYVGNSEA